MNKKIQRVPKGRIGSVDVSLESTDREGIDPASRAQHRPTDTGKLGRIYRMIMKHDCENLLAQTIRREIATLEWVTACANHELQKYGEWQCNWAEFHDEIQQTLDRLFSRANAMGDRSEP